MGSAQTRKHENEVARLFLYFLMRYDDFSIEEAQMTTDSSSGLRVRFASDTTDSDSDDSGVMYE
jgi:hypothetical protein